jgi:hypothetical protein
VLRFFKVVFICPVFNVENHPLREVFLKTLFAIEEEFCGEDIFSFFKKVLDLRVREIRPI